MLRGPARMTALPIFFGNASEAKHHTVHIHQSKDSELGSAMPWAPCPSAKNSSMEIPSRQLPLAAPVSQNRYRCETINGFTLLSQEIGT